MSDITFFAETNHRNQKVKFGIKRPDRRRHMYIIGKTGTGKTTLLDNMTIQDIQKGSGVAVLDPHGEYAERMLNFVPKERINDVVYFNPSDLDYPFGFNMLEKPDPKMRHFVASGLMGVFKKLWPDVWSARMEYFLSNSILAHLEMEDATLLGVNRIFGDASYRKAIVSRLQDPVVRGFWENEFAKLPEQFMREAVAAIQNKVGQFIANPLIRNIIGQPRSTFNLREIMDGKKILIANLSKGKIGEENSSLLGAMLVTRIYLAAMSRVDMPEEQREDFFVYVDEFQNFATESFASILSEARKYHLNLTLANQYMAQLVDDKTKSAVLRDAIIGNVGTMISFRIGAEDAEVLEKEFSPEFVIQDFVNLGFANIYLKLMIDNVASRPFSAVTLPPIPAPPLNCAGEVIEASEKKYGTPMQSIDNLIREWGGFQPLKIEIGRDAELPPPSREPKPEIRGGAPEAGAAAAEPMPIEHAVQPFAEGPKPISTFEVIREINRERERQVAEKRASKKKNQKMYPAVCAIDGKPIEVPFQPDGRRPVYCEEHLAQIQRGGNEGKRDIGDSKAANFPPPAQQPDESSKPQKREERREPRPISLDRLLPKGGVGQGGGAPVKKDEPRREKPRANIPALRKILDDMKSEIEQSRVSKRNLDAGSGKHELPAEEKPAAPAQIGEAGESGGETNGAKGGLIKPGEAVKF